jgi:hypothetical protein
LLEFRGVGYVANGRLVVSSDTPLNVRAGGSTLSIGSPQVSADIRLLDESGAPVDFGDPRATKYRLENGLIAGRASVPSLLKAIAPGHLNGGPRLCDDDLGSRIVFDRLRTSLCEVRDLRSARALDGTDASAPCESVSILFSFNAEPAFVGTGIGDSTEKNDPYGDENCDYRFPPVDAGTPILDASSDARSDAAVRDAAVGDAGVVDAGVADAARPNYLDPKTFFECP